MEGGVGHAIFAIISQQNQGNFSPSSYSVLLLLSESRVNPVEPRGEVCPFFISKKGLLQNKRKSAYINFNI